ncbi:hypothetical protein [Desulfitobacterium hafniense]|uniref:hypothetical protein n=1 Tax=Desulfitobacterium hafniense TaxID=49338 RepID=UPI00036D1BE9|nr:hypothetical protein [Desulfitobacterium hafniense]
MKNIKKEKSGKNEGEVACCPVCQSRAVGYIAKERLYCADCCVEFSTKKGMLLVFALSWEGELRELKKIG